MRFGLSSIWMRCRVWVSLRELHWWTSIISGTFCSGEKKDPSRSCSVRAMQAWCSFINHLPADYMLKNVWLHLNTCGRLDSILWGGEKLINELQCFHTNGMFFSLFWLKSVCFILLFWVSGSVQMNILHCCTLMGIATIIKRITHAVIILHNLTAGFLCNKKKMTEWEDERERFWKFSVPNGSFQYFTALLKKCL